MKFKISVPATSANIGPGYDIWGISLDIRNEFIVQVSPKLKEHIIKINAQGIMLKTSVGDPQKDLHNPNENLFIKSYRKILEKSNMHPVSLSVEVNLEIPLSRGLGSSSTAIVGGLLAGNEIIRMHRGSGHPLKYIYDLAGEIEGHPDNIAPAIYGGLVMNIKDEENNEFHPVKLPFKAPVKIAGLVPHITLATSDARKVVAQNNPLDVTIFQSSRTALLTHLFSKNLWDKQDEVLFGIALDDKVHQKARSVLIPGMMQTFKLWKEQGALGAYLSGAGSTLLSFWEKDSDLSNIEFRKALLDHGIESTVLMPEIDDLGSTIEQLT
jgi:homoserine kinase